MKLPTAAVFVILAVVHQTAALCLEGNPGYNAADFNITVARNTKTGCFTQKFGNLAISVNVCNGTNGAICPPPTISTTVVPTGCGKVSAATGSATFCNGTDGAGGDAGAAGLKGDQGAQGPLLTVSASGDAHCKVYLNTAGSAVTICNGTSNTTGATGAAGLQGVAGTDGLNGTTGLRGITGSNGYLPNVILVDGVNFAIGSGVGGLQLALNDAATAGGATVLLGGTCKTAPDCTDPFSSAPLNLVSSCSQPLQIPAGVTLDLGGNTISMQGGSTQCSPLIQFGTNAQQATTISINGLPLLANSTEGSNTVTIVANSILTANLAVGQICQLTNGYIQTVPTGLAPAISQTLRISAFTNSTGVVTFRRPLVANFGPSGSLTSTLTCFTPLANNIVLRNGFLSFGGNTHTSSYMVSMLQGINLELSNIQILDPAPSTTTTGMIQTGSTLDSRIDNVIVDSVETVTALLLQSSSGIFVSNVKVANSKSALSLGIGTHQCTISNLHASALSGVGISLVGSSFNSFDNVVVNTAAVRGIKLQSQSYRNVFHGLHITGGAGYGIDFAGTDDSFNQLYGVEIANNAGGPMIFGCGAAGNYIDGDIQGTALNCKGGATDPNFGQVVRQVANAKGFTALAMHNVTAAASDFTHPRMFTMSLDSDLRIRFTLYGGDGVVRSAKLDVS